jgi:hypothetical protein
LALRHKIGSELPDNLCYFVVCTAGTSHCVLG